MKFAFDLDEVLVKGRIEIIANKQLIKEGKISSFYDISELTDLSLTSKIFRDKIYELFNVPKYAVWKKEIIEGYYQFVNWCKREFKRYQNCYTANRGNQLRTRVI